MDLVQCRGLLQSLQNYGSVAGGVDDALEVWHTSMQVIKNACDTEDDRAVAASLLFDANIGILRFCKSSIAAQDQEGAKTRQEVWTWLAAFLDELPRHAIAGHATYITSEAIRSFRTEPASGPRSAILSCLQTLLELRRPEKQHSGAAAAVAAGTGSGAAAPASDGYSAAELVQMAQQLQGQYVRNRKLTPTVQGELLQTLGMLLDVGGQAFASDGPFTASWLLDEGQGVLRGPESKKAARAGAIAGISSALSLIQDISPALCLQLFEELLTVTKPTEVAKASRYSKLKAALRMLHINAVRFGALMLTVDKVYKDKTAAHTLFESLIMLKQHGNKPVREAAHAALVTFLQQLARELCKEGAHDGVDRAAIHKKLLSDLTSIVSDRKASGRDVATAVRGIGELAAPTLKFFGQEGLHNMVARLAPLAQQRALLQQVSDLQANKLGNEVELLQALASLVTLLEDVDAACLQLCSQVMAAVVSAYVHLWAKQRPAVHAALAALLSALGCKATALPDMLQQLVTSLLAATLAESDPDTPLGPAVMDGELEAPWRTYIHCWQALLQGSATVENQHWRRGLYDALMQAIMSAVYSLNLTYHTARQHQGEDDKEHETLAVGTGLQAANISDMRVFINLHAFAASLLPALGSAAFHPWAYTFTLRMVAASGRLPQLSGFYHLITTAMQLADAAGLLNSHQEVTDDTSHDTRIVLMLSAYHHDLLAASRQYSDELLAAALKLLLSAPVSVLPPQDVVTALQRALTLGLQYGPMADIAVTALERWERDRPQVLRQLAPDILPLLEPYLLEASDMEQAAVDATEQDGDQEGDEAGGEEDVLEAQREAGKEARFIQRGAAAAARRAQLRRQEGLRVLRPRILALLGRCGAAAEAIARSAALQMPPSGSSAAASPAASSEATDALLQWDLHRRAGLMLPFGDVGRLQLWLDPLLPQIARIAEHGADRAARVAACEFLHATTLWMIGTNAKSATSIDKQEFDSTPTPFHKLMQRLFPVILRLAVSQEQVARQLFSELSVSLVHWLTASARREAAEPMAFLDATIDGLVNENDGALRQLCARLCKEWLIWSGKHITGPRGTALNATSLLRCVLDRISHPNAYQRLGAALALEQMADPLGRQQELADAHLLEALAGCMHALELSEEDVDGAHTRQRIAAALAACANILKRKPAILEALKRPKPSRPLSDLPSFMLQLWPQTKVPLHFARRNATWLLTQLAHLLLQQDSPEKSVTSWVQQQLQDSNLASFLLLPPKVQLPASGLAANGATQWLKVVQAHLAWAAWAVELGIISTTQLQPGSVQCGAAGNHVVTALQTFLDAVHLIAGSTTAPVNGCLMLGSERTLRHMTLTFLEFQKQVLGELLLPPEAPALPTFLVLATLFPQRLGFDPAEAATFQLLPDKLKELLGQATVKQPTLLRQLRSTLEQMAVDQSSTMGQLLRNGLEASSAASTTVLQGLTMLADLRGANGSVANPLPKSLRSNLPDRLLRLAAGVPAGSGPQQRDAAEAGLQLALRLGLHAQTLLQALQDPTHGEALYANFRASMHTWVLFNAASCCGVLFHALGDMSDPAHQVSELLISGTLEALQRASASGGPDIRLGSFLQALLPQLQQLAPLLRSGNTGKELFLQLLSRLLSLSARTVLSPAQPAFGFVLDSYITLLSTKGTATADAQIRCRALALLPSFLEHTAADHQKRVLDGVERLVSGCFPLSSWEYPGGSTQATDYAAQLAAAFGALVQTAERSGSATALLEELQPVLMEMGEPKGHTRQASLVALLAQLAAAPWTALPAEGAHLTQVQGDAFSAGSRRANSLMEYAWLYVFGKPSTPAPLRRAMLTFVLSPLLRLAPRQYTKHAFEEKAKFLRDVINGDPALPKALRGRDAAAMTARLAAYQLFQIMYQVLPSADLKAVVRDTIGTNAEVMKPGRNDVKGFSNPASNDHELETVAREVRSAAFAATAALVVATQGADNLKFFKAPFEAAGDLHKLLDPDMELSFSEELAATDSAAKRAASNMHATLEAVKARRAAAGATATLGYSGSLSMGISLSDKLSASQYSLDDGGLVGETLGMEQGGNAAAHQTTLELAAAPVAGDVQDDLEGLDAPEGAAGDALLTEDDDLDRHPAMLPAVQLVERAAMLWAASSACRQGAAPMPDFLAVLHRVLATTATPHASRLFIVKVILHVDQRHMVGEQQKPAEERTPSIFGRYGAKFFGPMIDAIIGDADGGKDGMHYVLVDAICAAANWGDAVLMRMSSRTLQAHLPAEIDAPARVLLDYMARAAYSRSGAVVNNNFQLIKLLLQSWRYAVPLPADAILFHLEALVTTPEGMDSRKALQQRAAGRNRRIVGMKLLSAGVRYGQAPALLSVPEGQQILAAVADSLAVSGGTRLAAAAGECIGYLLETLTRLSKAPAPGPVPDADAMLNKLSEEARKCLVSVAGTQKDPSRFLHAVERISTTHSRIVELLATPLLNLLKRVPGQLACLLLETLARGPGQLPELLPHLRSALQSILSMPNPAVHAALLSLLSAVLPHESDSSAGPILQQVIAARLGSSDSTAVRRGLAELLRNEWERRPELRDSLLRAPLLALLSDADGVIRLDAQRWCTAVLPQQVPERLHALLSPAQSSAADLRPQLEKQWSSAAAEQLLRLPRNDRDANAPLFSSGLAECKFQDYQIDTNQQATLQMAPMFSTTWSASQGASQSAVSQASQYAAGAGSTLVSRTQVGLGMVRATQPGTMSQSYSFALAPPMDSQLIPAGSQGAQGSAARTAMQGAWTPSQTASQGGSLTVRRRLSKAASQQAGIVANIRRKEAAFGASALARHRKVTLLRSYRTGELPDIEGLRLTSFLSPLSVLVQRDFGIARLVLQGLWSAALQELGDQAGGSNGAKRRKEAPDELRSLRSALSDCFKQGSKEPVFVQALQALALADRESYVAPELAAASALAANSLQAGVLQIEQQIIMDFAEDAAAPPLKSRRTSAVAGQTKLRGTPAAWAAAASLYSELGDDNLMQTAFSRHVAKCPGTRSAMRLFREGHPNAAFLTYEQLLKAAGILEDDGTGNMEEGGSALPADPAALLGGAAWSQEEERLWQSERLRALEVLGNWPQVLSVIDSELLPDDDNAAQDQDMEQVPEDDRLFTNAAHHLRPWVRACLFHPADAEQVEARERLGKVVHLAATDATRRDALRAAAPVEVATHAALLRDWVGASAAIEDGWSVFREQWAALHPLSHTRRRAALDVLQPLAEFQEAAAVVRALQPSSVAEPALQQLADVWSQRWPSPTVASPDAILTVHGVRQAILEALPACISREVVHRLNLQLTLAATSNMRAAGHLDAAADLLAQRGTGTGGNPELLVVRASLRIDQLGAASSGADSKRAAGYVRAEVKQLEAARASVIDAAHARALLLLQGQAHQQLYRHGTEPAQHLPAALRCIEEAACGDGAAAAAEVAQASLQLALLVDEVLQEEEARSDGSATAATDHAAAVRLRLPQGSSTAALLVKHLLHAMHAGGDAGQQAQLYVPRLLDVLAGGSTPEAAFTSGWRSVPLPAFLPWAPSMLSLLDEPHGEALLPALEALAAAYPQHLYFPFRLSCGHLGADGQRRAAALAPVLSSPLLEAYASALNDTTYPGQRWDGWTQQLLRLLQDNKQADAAKLFKEEVYPDIIGRHERGRGRGEAGAVATVNAIVAQKHGRAVRDAFGVDGAQLQRMSVSDFRKASSRTGQALKRETQGQAGRRDLAQLSPWFERFASPTGAMSGAEQLLMPAMPGVGGAASGVTVVGFGKSVHVFSSKQAPKKLTIYGSDFASHDWVLKGGEEVRTDQRVEQLFNVMNGLLQRSPAAATANLQVATYDVVPITPALGMLAFVGGTKPLLDVISPDLVDANGKANDSFYAGIHKLARASQGESPAAVYERLFSARRADVIRNLEAIQAQVREDGLREALLRSAVGPEAFLAMRSNFTSSLAAVSATSYVAGVGDRHLQNFLLHEQSATIVPIDFGYAFGTATQALPVPELMPFRLTRQLAGTLAPHDASAVLRQPMGAVMGALREGAAILQGVLGVFLREPLADWQREARLLQAGATADAEEEYISLKVAFAKRRLSGDHPAELTVAELATRHKHKKHWPALQAIVRGQVGSATRADYPSDTHLDVDAQVVCLLDQATDPDILGRTWWGWRPWC